MVGLCIGVFFIEGESASKFAFGIVFVIDGYKFGHFVPCFVVDLGCLLDCFNADDCVIERL